MTAQGQNSPLHAQCPDIPALFCAKPEKRFPAFHEKDVGLFKSSGPSAQSVFSGQLWRNYVEDIPLTVKCNG